MLDGLKHHEQHITFEIRCETLVVELGLSGKELVVGLIQGFKRVQDCIRNLIVFRYKSETSNRRIDLFAKTIKASGKELKPDN